MNTFARVHQFIQEFNQEEQALPAWLELLDLLLNDQAAGQHPLTPDQIARLWRFGEINQKMERHVERRLAEDPAFAPSLKETYLHFYNALCQQESRMLLDHGSPQFTCFVGCGSIPISLLLFSKRFDACVFGLDLRKECIRLAGQFIDRRHRARPDFDHHKIQLVHSAGEAFDYRTSRNIILSASMPALAKRRMLKRILDTCQRGTTFLLNRIPVGIGNLLYEHCPSFTLFQCPGLRPLATESAGLISSELFQIGE